MANQPKPQDQEKTRVHAKREKELASYVMLVGAVIAFFNSAFIPPLLLRPSAENAMWHGLSHEHIFILHDNDAIGQQKTNKLSIKKFYSSMGTPLSEEQINSYNLKHQDVKSFMITDEIDGNGISRDSRMELAIEPSKIDLRMNLYCIKHDYNGTYGSL